MKMCPCILSFMLSFSSTTESYAVNLTVMLLSVHHLPKVIDCESVGLNQFISDFILVGDDGLRAQGLLFCRISPIVQRRVTTLLRTEQSPCF